MIFVRKPTRFKSTAWYIQRLHVFRKYRSNCAKNWITLYRLRSVPACLLRDSQIELPLTVVDDINIFGVGVVAIH